MEPKWNVLVTARRVEAGRLTSRFMYPSSEAIEMRSYPSQTSHLLSRRDRVAVEQPRPTHELGLRLDVTLRQSIKKKRILAKIKCL